MDEIAKLLLKLQAFSPMLKGMNAQTAGLLLTQQLLASQGVHLDTQQMASIQQYLSSDAVKGRPILDVINDPRTLTMLTSVVQIEDEEVLRKMVLCPNCKLYHFTNIPVPRLRPQTQEEREESVRDAIGR